MRSRKRAPRSGGPRPAGREGGGARSWPRPGSGSGWRDGSVRAVRAWAAHASEILLQVGSIGTGALLVGLTGITSLESRHPGSRAALVGVLAASSAALAAVRWPAVARRLVGLVTGSGEAVTSP